ncbi:MAG: extracellular solute-binding protein [candidate division KSB1 bacterium]|nr:extracellular solute-binding protein [candidate division KSB1 bacterium]MDZ7336339.1 extracellular solute-binding protein [candidate division KSB1 bacterium]MDZ7400023.1 extracellular solute-binding protein [candidate division KSB1 bacterium]
MKESTRIVLIILFLLSSCSQDDQNKIRFTHIYDALGGPTGKQSMDWVNARVAEFQALHPELKVELEQAKWDQIDTKCMADYRAGIVHDVVITSPQFLPKHQVVGDLLDLRPLLNWDETQKAEFSWNPVWQACVQQGKWLGIPMGAHTRVCVYWKDQFAAVGLDPDRPPKTLDEMVDYAQKLTRDLNGDGKTDVWGLGMYFGPSRATIEISFAPLIWHFGGELWDEHSKQAVFASPAGVHAAQFLSDLLNKYQVIPRWAVSGTYDDVVMRAFFDRRVAMAWGWGSYWIQPLEEQGLVAGCYPPTPDGEMIKIGIFITPTVPQAQFTNAWTISIHALSQKPHESIQFLKKFIDPKALCSFPDAGLPAALSLWQSPEYQTEFYKIWFEAASKGRSMPPTAHYEELSNTVAAALQEILIKNAPVEATLTKFQRSYNSRYAGE